MSASHENHEHHARPEKHAGHADHSGHGDHAAHADHAAAGHGTAPDHGGHGHGHHGHGGKVSWRMAASATLHCLTGCAIGEVLGMIIGTALGWHNAPTMVLAIVLAFVFGYGLTMFGIRKAGLGLVGMIKVALAADTVSIIVMEIVDNGMLLLIPGAMDAHLGDALFWGALAVAFLVAFGITTPVNKWLIGKGKGHAVVHGMH